MHTQAKALGAWPALGRVSLHVPEGLIQCLDTDGHWHIVFCVLL